MGHSQEEFDPRARRREGIVGLRAPHMRPNLGSGDGWSEGVSDGDKSAHLRDRGVSSRPDDDRSRIIDALAKCEACKEHVLQRDILCPSKVIVEIPAITPVRHRQTSMRQ
ncbi:jg12874 [Pararge aegeria aegeria]|uniref:Jg12874 protein n=1 Tax=Pararge aegeria aegeria TaxID=348720 RepID=A0A8S4RXB9_9NEOP|nr:jg12874 [Pararge aegeria aegeria]